MIDQTKPAAEAAPPVSTREAELAALAANLQGVAEAEKVLLARLLHDELGGALVGAKMDLAWLRRRIGSTEPEVMARWDRLERALETGIGFKRRVVEQLRPTLLDNLGFYAAARWFVEETCAATSLKVDLDLKLPEPLLSKEAGIALFRVLQESLSNVVRHAKASRVKISVHTAPGLVYLTIRDDGVGMSPDRLKQLGSHGLGSMHHRMVSLGGQFRVSSGSGQGTEIEAVAPLREAA